jgi:hypothetical protein
MNTDAMCIGAMANNISFSLGDYTHLRVSLRFIPKIHRLRLNELSLSDQ